MRYYYADPTNNPVGPYQLEDLHQLHAEGVIQADTLVAEEGGASWFPYRSLVIPPPVERVSEESWGEGSSPLGGGGSDQGGGTHPPGMNFQTPSEAPAYSSPPPVGAGAGTPRAGTTLGP